MSNTSTKASPVPEWLQRAHNIDHLSNVLVVLAQREKAREKARMASRIKANPSLLHRFAHLPSTALEPSANIDHYSVSIAAQPENRRLNRYADVEAYDRTRVIVGCGGTEPSGRYLNASWVRELNGGKWWIATQAPLPETAHAFLSVLLQPVAKPFHPHPHADITQEPQPLPDGKTCRVRTIVQLTREIEAGTRKAHTYFPPVEGESWIIPPEEGCSAPSVKVTLVKLEEIPEAHCLMSTVSVQSIISTAGTLPQVTGEEIVFKHMLYSSWPDHGVPELEHRAALLHFIHLVDTVNRDVSSQPSEIQHTLDSDPPIMVNCSAGIGRTGSFIAISSLLRRYKFLPPPTSIFNKWLDEAEEQVPNLEKVLGDSPLGPLHEELEEDLIAMEIDALREQRPGMVQRKEQVILIYELLIAAFYGEEEKH
ncbi:protein-tyrosine phosphatase-like protein [Abortiporus biennis]|nr:protein-tyrosine phosphatase-like protein [Abortiporus biennis]